MEGETGGPRLVRVEGDFFLFKTLEFGQELICQLEEIFLKMKTLSFTVRRNIKLEVYRDPASFSDSSSLAAARQTHEIRIKQCSASTQ